MGSLDVHGLRQCDHLRLTALQHDFADIFPDHRQKLRRIDIAHLGLGNNQQVEAIDAESLTSADLAALQRELSVLSDLISARYFLQEETELPPDAAVFLA